MRSISCSWKPGSVPKYWTSANSRNLRNPPLLARTGGQSSGTTTFDKLTVLVMLVHVNAHSRFLVRQLGRTSDPREAEPHRYLEALLAAELANLDWNAGRLFETLSRHSLLNETLIIFTSDPGRTWIDRRGSTEQRIALSYEEVARVPLILR